MVERTARTGPSAKALLLTILGEFVLPNHAAAWTATLIGGLHALGVSEPNARQAAARLAEQNVLRPRRVGRATRWELTGVGRHLLVSGAHRIYHLGDATRPWNRQWLLVLAAIPEEQRAKRVALRTQLAFEGFGFLGGGVAISPHTERRHQAERIVSALELDPAPLIFTARSVPSVPEEQIIGRAWDLDGLAARYDAFVERFQPLQPSGGAEHFSAVVRLVHHWRAFPFEDPGIPNELLPQEWSGHGARTLFDQCRADWSEQAQRWFQGLEDDVATPAQRSTSP